MSKSNSPKDPAITKEEVDKITNDMPDPIKRLQDAGEAVHYSKLFTGSQKDLGRIFAEKGKVDIGSAKTGQNIIYGTVDEDGMVYSMAASVDRKPTRSYDYVKNIRDFTQDSGNPRQEKIPTWYRIVKQEGILNNAINKTAAFVGSDGEFSIRSAKKGKKRVEGVKSELGSILDYWKRNVNASPRTSAITGARGLSSIINQGTRQALIEGSWIGLTHDAKIEVPSLGNSYTLPMFIQTMSTQYLDVPEALVGTGLELFIWKPPKKTVDAITNPNENVKSLINNSFDKEVISQLSSNGEVILDPERVIHIKHRGFETEPFGNSFVEPVVSDLAYKRSLQALDFVTIEALINRLVIVTVGSDNPDSKYHNIEFAQQRLNLLQRMFNTVDPAMTILWAGPDINVIDIGAHESIADLDGRYEVAHERLLFSMGVPRALLDGSSGGDQIWAAYEGYRETLKEIQDSFAQALVSIGERIAEANGFEGVELSFEFDRAVLADQTSASDLALRARKAGLYSIKKTLSDLGVDYLTERRNRRLERGLDPEGEDVTDEELFSPPLGMPGDTRTDPNGNVVDPGGEGGRPPGSQREDLSNKERDPDSKPSAKE